MATSFVHELRGWKETESMSDDARRKVWLMHTAADEIDRLRAVLEEIKAGRSNDPQLDAIRALAAQ